MISEFLILIQRLSRLDGVGEQIVNDLLIVGNALFFRPVLR